MNPGKKFKKSFAAAEKNYFRNMLTVSGLYIYPVKSLGGIAVDSAMVTGRGLQHDRRLMLVDEKNQFLTQRAFPGMACLQPIFTSGGLEIHHKKNLISPLLILAPARTGDTVPVTIWDDTCEAILYDAGINQWFSKALGFTCRLVYMPGSSERAVDRRYAKAGEITSFSDAYPILIIGQASLDDLNNRLELPVPMNRFRPNIVFTGGAPFLEDQLGTFTINGIEFKAVKPCARCVMTTIDQEDMSTSKEPLKTLAGFRNKDSKILFGQNLLHTGEGGLQVGDIITVNSYQPAAI